MRYVVFRPNSKIIYSDFLDMVRRVDRDKSIDRAEQWNYSDDGIVKEDITEKVKKILTK